MKPSIKSKVHDIIDMMDNLINDTTIPKNIRKLISDAKDRVEGSSSETELEVNVAQAVYLLDEALNDINLPFHVRTDVMEVISNLESLKEEIK